MADVDSCLITDDLIKLGVDFRLCNGVECGGRLVDKLSLASERMIKDYEKMFPRDGRSCRPLDIDSSYIPSILDLGGDDLAFSVAFINWSDREKSFSYSFKGTYTACEHWEDKPLGTYTDLFSITLKAHASCIVHFKITDIFLKKS